MKVKNWLACVVALACATAAVGAAFAEDDKPTDGGKGSAFKSKTYEMKDKGEVALVLTFEAGKAVTVTTNGTKETDVHLFVTDAEKKEVGKDTSPGPKCEVKFTPKKDGKYNLLLKNSGGSNKVTLEVKVAE